MMDKIVVFVIDDLKYALPLNAVIRAIHAIEIRKLPQAPEIVAGIINLAGRIIPVIDVRKRFGLKCREISADDELIIAETGKRIIALWIDHVSGVQQITAEQYTDTADSLSFAAFIKGVVKLEGEIILIYDLEQFLNLEEESQLETALTTIQ